MLYLIVFESGYFPLAAEPEHPINPIPGRSVAKWLEPMLRDAGAELSELGAEDWGWTQQAKLDDQQYQVGYSATLAADDEQLDEVIIRLSKQRSTAERWLLRNRFTNNDKLLNLIVNVVDKLEDVPSIQIMRQ